MDPPPLRGSLPPDRESGPANATLVGRYRQDGFVVIPGVLEPEDVDACVRYLHHLRTVRQQAGPIFASPLETDEFLAGVANDARLTGIAGSLLDSEPVPFGCTYVVKEAHGEMAAWWHQDGYPWRTRLGIREALTLWLALDRSDEVSGGLRVIPGSHRLPALPLRPHPGQVSIFGCGMDADLVDATRSQPVALETGDLSAHHSNLIHSSGPNRSAHPRRGLAIRYRGS